ncbi:MAG TPA: type VI secretion system contractile sheath large subunit, partial [Burkholderiaceae bacterium]|nr:type VI secretion system contractile sheath large subunit [Burkholderiaceae bacterium]
KIRVMHLSKAELGRTLAKSTTWNQNPLFKRVHEDVYTTFGGEPFACLVGDYTFDHSPADVALLRDLARICAASHAPFMAAASPALLGLQSWRELARFRPSPKRFVTDEYLAWRRLSESDESRHLAFAMPRFLARAPYGGNGTEVEDFDYQEDVGEGDPDRHPWCNAAYAMAVNITRAFKLYGWCARICGIESGGAVEGLPTHRFPTRAGEIDSKCPVEIALDDRVEAELAALGLMPLLHRKNSDFAAFIGACSLHKPFQYDDPATTASARLAARLPYLLACNRFVQVIKCLVRDRVGSFVNVSEMERSLQRWIANYVDPEPDVSSDARAARPLAAADVRVDEVEGNPGYYALCCWLRPHYQLEGLSVSLRVVSQLPAAKALM